MGHENVELYLKKNNLYVIVVSILLPKNNEQDRIIYVRIYCEENENEKICSAFDDFVRDGFCRRRLRRQYQG